MRYDISMPIRPGMPVYKNYPDKTPSYEVVRTFEQHSVYETNITMNLHTGTHLDFPKHTLPDGDVSTNHDLDLLIGSARVIDLTKVDDGITREMALRERTYWINTFNPVNFCYLKQKVVGMKCSIPISFTLRNQLLIIWLRKRFVGLVSMP